MFLEQASLQPRLHAIKRYRQIFRLAASCHRHFWAAAAFASDLLSDHVHQLAGFDSVGDLFTDTCHEVYSTLRLTGKHNHRGAQLIFQLIDRIAQRLWIEAFDIGDQNLNSFQLDSARPKIIASTCCHLRFKLRELFLEDLILAQQAGQLVQQTLGRGFQQR